MKTAFSLPSDQGGSDAANNSFRKLSNSVFRVPNIASKVSAVGNTSDARQQSDSQRQNVERSQSVDNPPDRLADASSVASLPDKSKTNLVPKLDAAAEESRHPLDRAIEIAKVGLENIQSNIRDYTAIMVKRERVGDQLSDPMFMKIKIRNPRVVENQNVPFSIYMKFLKPREVVGREVIWVEGKNGNRIVVHDTNPLVRFKNLHLDPDGFLAMKGNRYPIYEAGLEKLVMKLIEKAERDRAAGICDVEYRSGAVINQRPCTLIEVTHHERRPPYEFNIAKVYIDDEYQIPVRFVAYDWPGENGKPRLIEEYTYINVALNVGLDDEDFAITNQAYNFAR